MSETSIKALAYCRVEKNQFDIILVRPVHRFHMLQTNINALTRWGGDK
jgi:hypothetical protein